MSTVKSAPAGSDWKSFSEAVAARQPTHESEFSDEGAQDPKPIVAATPAVQRMSGAGELQLVVWNAKSRNSDKRDPQSGG